MNACGLASIVYTGENISKIPNGCSNALRKAAYTIPGPNSGCVCDVTLALQYAEETTKVFVLDPDDGKLEWAVPS